MFRLTLLMSASLCLTFSLVYNLSAQSNSEQRIERFRQMSDKSEERGLATPFKGITTNGEVEPGLFEIHSTGVTTEPVRKAAIELLNALNQDQQKKTQFPIDDPEWRKWMNQHFYVRQGVGFDEMSEDQRNAAFGLLRSSLSAKQKDQLLSLIKLYVDNMKEGHAKVRMEEVSAHIDETYFAWIGGMDNKSTYYYRIHSPVIIIEFDHQTPANLRHIYPPGVPNRQHIHAVVRTPNGNDYGKDL